MRTEKMQIKNNKRREQRWTKRICITDDTNAYIESVLLDRKYKTMAGTLDAIINEHKNYGSTK